MAPYLTWAKSQHFPGSACVDRRPAALRGGVVAAAPPRPSVFLNDAGSLCGPAIGCRLGLEVNTMIGNVVRGLSLALALAVAVIGTSTAPANAGGGVSPGAAVGIGLGSF